MSKIKFTDLEIEQMRFELANPEAMKKRVENDVAIYKFIEATKQQFNEQGRDFYAEYEAWKAQKDREIRPR